MELWDIYDANKERTGRTMKRNDWCLKDGEYHLTVLGVVARPDGKFLITKRVMTKSWAPGWWEVSGGGVMAGEDSIDAVKREVLEETGLDVEVVKLIGVYTDCDMKYASGDEAHSIVIGYELKVVGGNLFCDGNETLELEYFSRDDKPELFCKQHEEFWRDIFGGNQL